MNVHKKDYSTYNIEMSVVLLLQSCNSVVPVGQFIGLISDFLEDTFLIFFLRSRIRRCNVL